MPFTLPSSTGAASLTDASTTEAQQKTNLTNLRGFIAEMLGTDSTSRDVVRSLLGIDHPALTFSVASSALTIALKTPAGADATSAAPLTIPFRSATSSSGALAVRKATAAVSLVVSSGSTLGTSSGADAWLFIYALDNSGTIELAVTGTYYGSHYIGNTTAEGGAGGADSETTIYSTTGRTGVAMRLLAAVRSNQTTAGTWAAVPLETRLAMDNDDIESGTRRLRDVAASRATGTTYTNSTGREIDVYVRITGSATNPLRASINATVVYDHTNVSSSYTYSFSLRVPPGATYVITAAAATIQSWLEVR
jgi:hypothetical protein